MDNRLVQHEFGWQPETSLSAILKEIAGHARATPGLAGIKWLMKSPPPTSTQALNLLSVVIPARDEAGCIASTVEHLHVELRLHGVPHEIVVVDDGSTDETWQILNQAPTASRRFGPFRIPGLHGFGRAIIFGLDHMRGDAAVIMMSDESDDCRDVVTYWRLLNQGWDAVFGSRFIRGGGVIDYPAHKLLFNRLANAFLKLLFNIPLNDTTNAFKAYRRTVIEAAVLFSRRTSI